MESTENYRITRDQLVCTIKGVVAAEAIEQKYGSKKRDCARTINLPGFRKGKVPVSLVEKRFGEALLGEILEEEVKAELTRVIDLEKLDLAASPKVELSKRSKGQDQAFTVVCECYPELSEAWVKKITLTEWDVKASSEDKKHYQKELVDKNQAWAALKKGDKLKEGYAAFVDFAGTIDGKAFTGSEAQGYKMVLGEGKTLPQFEQAVLSMKVGEQKDGIAVVFPEDYHESSLAGKNAEFSITLIKAEKPEKLKEGKELFEKLGSKALTWKEYQPEMDRALNLRAVALKEAVQKVEFVRSALDVFEYEVPNTLFQKKKQSLKEQKVAADLLDEEARKHAVTDLVFRFLIKHYNISATESEVDAYISDLIDNQQSLEFVKQWYKQDAARLQYIQSSVVEKKMLDSVYKDVQIKDKKDMSLAKAKEFSEQEI